MDRLFLPGFMACMLELATEKKHYLTFILPGK